MISLDFLILQCISFFIVFNGYASAKYNEFGCTFENREYKLTAPEPIWSELPTETWQFDTKYGAWITLKNDINRIFAEVMEESVLNDVDHFIEFCQAYQNQKGSKQDLVSFFRDYSVPFRPMIDSAGIVIEVFRRLKLSHSKAANHSYLITAYVNPNVNIDILNSSEWLSRNLTNSWFQEHVAGVIQIGLEGRSGYFLLDPLYSSRSPVLLFKDVRYIIQSKNDFEITWTSERNTFIVAENKGTGSPGVKQIMYYLEKRFCSFMDSTTKGALLLPEHKIEKRTATGESVAYLTFQMYQVRMVDKGKRYITVGVNDSSVTGGFQEKNFTFEDVQQGGSQNAQKLIEKLSVNLNIKEKVLISKIVTLQTVLFQHDDLLNEMIKLQSVLRDKRSLQLNKMNMLQSELNEKRSLQQIQQLQPDMPYFGERLLTNAKYNIVGCTFENDQYKLRAPEPIWSKPPTEYWQFSTTQYTEWITFKNDVNRIFAKVIEESILNDVDHLIEFCQAYQNQKGSKQDLVSFFRDYSVPFRPMIDSAGIVIEVFRRLQLFHPGEANHSYLITAYVNPNVNIDILNSSQWPSSVKKKLTNSWFQEHVAGVIQVSFEGKSGYFLLDPLYSSRSPVLLLADPKFRDVQHTIKSKDDFEITWTFGKNTFIVAENKGTGSPGVKQIVYYLEKQFCSFMDSTTKGALLLPEHKIEKRTATGESVAYLTFQMYQLRMVDKGKRYITVGVNDSSVTGGFVEQNFAFEDVQQGKISQDARKIIKKFSENLNIKEEVLISKIVTIQTVLFQHDDLLNEMINLQSELKDKSSLQPDRPGIGRKLLSKLSSCGKVLP